MWVNSQRIVIVSLPAGLLTEDDEIEKDGPHRINGNGETVFNIACSQFSLPEPPQHVNLSGSAQQGSAQLHHPPPGSAQPQFQGSPQPQSE